MRQIDVQVLFVEQRLHRLIVIVVIMMFSLRIGIIPLCRKGLILICHLKLRLRKM